MRTGLITATAAGLLGVAAVLVAVPMVSGGTASSTPSQTLQVATGDGPCSDLTVTATVSGDAYRPVLDVFSLTRLTGLEVSDIQVVGDPACGDAIESYVTSVSLSNGECDQARTEELGTESLCDGTALALTSSSATGEVSEQGVYSTYPLGAAWADGDRWCATLDAEVVFDTGSGQVSDVAPPGQLCVELG